MLKRKVKETLENQLNGVKFKGIDYEDFVNEAISFYGNSAFEDLSEDEIVALYARYVSNKTSSR